VKPYTVENLMGSLEGLIGGKMAGFKGLSARGRCKRHPVTDRKHIHGKATKGRGRPTHGAKVDTPKGVHETTRIEQPV
jgi:hypothetical protein